METRVLRALEAAQRSERSHGWALRFAPVLGTLAAGVVLGMLIGHRRAQERTPIVPVQCAAALPRSIALDLDAYAGSSDLPAGEIEVGVGRTTLRLPRRLTSRGPYQTGHDAARRRERRCLSALARGVRLHPAAERHPARPTRKLGSLSIESTPIPRGSSIGVSRGRAAATPGSWRGARTLRSFSLWRRSWWRTRRYHPDPGLLRTGY